MDMSVLRGSGRGCGGGPGQGEALLPLPQYSYLRPLYWVWRLRFR